MDDRVIIQPIPVHQIRKWNFIQTGNPQERFATLDRMIIIAICLRGKLLDGTQGGAGSDIARGDQKFLPNLQGPILLQAVQSQYPVHGDVIGTRNWDQGLIGLHFVDDPAIGVRGLGDNHANGSRRGIASRILVRDE